MNRSDDRGGKPQPTQPSSPQQQQQGGDDKQYGEGNYKATRDYDRGVKEHMRTHDVEREARDAAPRSDEEATEMREAEDLGKKKAQGMQDSKDRMDRPGSGTPRDVK
jgi:hypothetical protein